MSVRGWCPGALRPMDSGDGLIVRVRPHASRLTAAQAQGLADLALEYGAGVIDLGSRANLQLRGIRESALPAIRAALADLNLLDPDPEAEARRNILTAPVETDSDEGRETLALVAALETALARAPALPPKFGFAIDTGPASILGSASADIRIERGAGGLIVRADGMEQGTPLEHSSLIGEAIALAHWFAAQRGAHRRMAPLIAEGTLPPFVASTAPLTAAPPQPGPCSPALPFGQISAADLRQIARGEIRLTPWRMILVAAQTEIPATLITDPADPLLRVHACTGAPGCAQASVETRALARRLAPLVPAGGVLHVSGCAKGCAHPHPALTLTGHDGAFDLIPYGRAEANPTHRALRRDDIPDLIRGQFAPLL